MKKNIQILIITCFLIQACTLNLNSELEKGIKLSKEGQYQEAIKQFDKVLEKDSTSWDAWVQQGNCYSLIGEYDKSVSDYYQAMKIRPNDTTLLVYIATDLGDNKEYQKSITAFKKALSQGVKLNQIDYFNLGSGFYFLAKMDSAKKYLRTSINLGPENSKAYNNLAWAYLDNDPEKSCYYFNEAYLKDTTNSININNLGYSHLLCGNLDLAFNFFTKAEKFDSSNSFIYRNYGLYYLEKGEKDLACLNLQKSIKLNIMEDWGEEYIQDLISYCENK